ncbi:lysophospholipid acyltransferase family protein [Prosthecomicrobium sp. N25]|uniref:lysophospholipid acyltransferase family protein n=1 Tax=Prosthecomicrobium sp. N25 TaxID=3129254 RepID=UPI0030774627
MLILRSLAFNVAFYANMILWMVAIAPALLMPRPVLWWLVRHWSRLNVWLLEHVAGTKVEVRGLDRLPPGGCIVASKHQSTFETLCLFDLFHEPAFILKRELMWIPLFGWFAARTGMIPVDRNKGREALRDMTRRALVEMQHGRSILIYPEGTRRPPGAEPAYKIGVAHLYRETGMSVVPVALNSGLFWPRRGFRRHPGTLVVEILPPIGPGLDMAGIMARLQADIEAASDRLLQEAVARDPSLPLGPDARDRLATLRSA